MDEAHASTNDVLYQHQLDQLIHDLEELEIKAITVDRKLRDVLTLLDRVIEALDYKKGPGRAHR
jgi:hypothetical protein